MEKEDQLRLLKAASGIEDETFLISVLDAHKWDVEQSLNLLLGDGGATNRPASNVSARTEGNAGLFVAGTAVPRRTFEGNWVDLTADDTQGMADTNDFGQRDGRLSPAPLVDLSGANDAANMNLTVKWIQDDLHIPITDTTTVHDLKRTLEALTGVPASSQELVGWPVDREPLNATRISSIPFTAAARELILLGEPRRPAALNNGAQLTENDDDDMELAVEDDSLFDVITVTVLWHGDALSFALPADNTVSDLKNHVQLACGMPVLRQRLHHLPSNELVDGQRTLASVAARYGDRQIRLSLSTTPADTEGFDSDSERDIEMEEPLVDPGVDDESLACAQFAAHFGPTYGEPHPEFYVGPLADALKTSRLTCKPVLIYVHQSHARGAHDFCRNVLCNPIIADYLRENFIVWGWDVTSNRRQLMRLVDILNALFDDYPFVGGTEFPSLAVITRIAGAYAVDSMRFGVQELEDLYAWLMGSHESASVHLAAGMTADREIEEERATRERIRIEQDEAYQASLAADQQRAAEKEAIARQEQAVVASREQKERDRLASIDALSRLSPVEPSAEEPGTFEILVRLPNGMRLRRRFLPTHTMQELRGFIAMQGLLPGEYRLFKMHPRTDLGDCAAAATLPSAGIAPRDTLVIESAQ